jgi:hypothetical protein
VALNKRDVFFFLERLSEQLNTVYKIKYKKQFGIFRNFKIRRGNIKLTSYVLQSLISPTEVSRVVDIYNLIGQSLCSYSIGPLPCLFTVYYVKSLNTYSGSYENIIDQDFSNSIVVLNTQSKNNEESIQCIVNYTITIQ